MTLTQAQRIEKITDAAVAAFWAEVARQCPEITTGDLDPAAAYNFDGAAIRVVETWIEANTPKEKI